MPWIDIISLLCVTYIFGFYITIGYLYLKHRLYLNAILRRTYRYNKKTKSLHGCLCTKVAPMYRKEYFGYEYFVLPDFGNKSLIPDNKMRTFGMVRPYKECVLIVKDDYVKVIIALEDKRYPEKVEEDLRRIYRNMVVLISGGVLVWQICLWYMT